MRAVVLGPAAAGKTAFAQELSALTGIENIELDSIFWSESLEPLQEAEWHRRQQKLVARDSWILDGDLFPHDIVETRLKTTTVVLLLPSTQRCVWRALKRGRRNRDFQRWLLTWRRQELPRIEKAIADHAPTSRVLRIGGSPTAALVELAMIY